MHCVEMGMLNSVWKLFLEGCMSLLESEASLGPPITNLHAIVFYLVPLLCCQTYPRV